MRVSLTNIVNQVFFRKNEFSIFAKLAFFNKGFNASFSGELENLSESHLTKNLDDTLNLLEFFKTSKGLEAMNNGTFNEESFLNIDNSLQNLEYFHNLEYLFSLEKISEDEEINKKSFDQYNYGFKDRIFFERKKNILRFKKEFSDFFIKTFEENESLGLDFLSHFKYIQCDDAKIADFLIMNYKENFYSKYLLRIAQIVFIDQIDEVYAEKASEIKENFEKILFNNRIWDDSDNKTYFDDLLDESTASFMKKLFWEPYQKLLKLKRIFDAEISLGDKKNEELLISIILLASQIGIYQAKHSADFMVKLIDEHLECYKDHFDLLEASHKVFQKLSKTLQIAKWDQGLLHVIEKIGIETEECDDKLDKLFKFLNLEAVKIFEVKKHPNSDFLNLCKLSNGEEVVCGAGNVNFIKDNGYFTIYSPIGSSLPNGAIISPKKIRGIISKGMLCSLEELCADSNYFLNNYPDIFFNSISQNNEISINKDPKTSGIIVLFEPKNFNSDDEKKNEIPFIGKYFSMHSWADLSLTPNLGSLIGEMNLAKEIESFLTISPFSQKINYNYNNKKLLNNINNNFNLKNIISNLTEEVDSFESEIIVSEDTRHFFRNIFFFKTSESKIQFSKNDLDHISVFFPGFDFQKENKISSLVKYFSGLYGIELHAIRKNSFKGLISIKASLKDCNLEIHPKDFENSNAKIKIFKGELCAFDQNEDIIFIPGVTNTFKHCGMLNSTLTQEQSNEEILFIGLIFCKDKESNFNFYTPQIKLSQRESINNRMTHFYQRQPIFDLENFLKLESNDLNNFVSLMDYKSLDDKFKKIKFDVMDMLILFKKDSKLIYGILDAFQENMKFQSDFEKDALLSKDLFKNSILKTRTKKNFFDCKDNQRIILFFDYIYENFIKKEFQSFGFEIIAKELNFNEKDQRLFFELETLVPHSRTDINSSIDFVAILYKKLNFLNKLSITNDKAPAFFKENENFSDQSYKVLKFIQSINSNKHGYDENSDLNSFEVQSENTVIPMIYNGENNFKKCFYSALTNLAFLGFSEVLHFSFISDEKIHDFLESKNLVKLKSPINKTLTILRPNLLIGLLEKYTEIIKEKKNSPILLFENGPVFLKNNPFEKVLTGILGGKKIEKNHHVASNLFSDNNFFDFFDSKFAFLKVLETCNIREDNLEFFAFDEFYNSQNKEKFENFHKIMKDYLLINSNSIDPYEKFFHPKKTALIFAKNLNFNTIKNNLEYIFIGYCGEINPFFLEKFDLIDKCHEIVSAFVIFQTGFEKIYKNKEKYIPELFFSEFQSIHRDFTLIFSEEITISQIKNNILNNSNQNLKLKNLIHDLKIFDIFQSDDLKKQKKKSVGFSLKIWNKNKTLNDKELKEIVNLILEKIKNELGGVFLDIKLI